MASFEVKIVLEYKDNTKEKIRGHIFIKNPYDNDELFDEITDLIDGMPDIENKEFSSIFASVFVDKEEIIYLKLEGEYVPAEDIECKVIIPENMTIH